MSTEYDRFLCSSLLNQKKPPTIVEAIKILNYQAVLNHAKPFNQKSNWILITIYLISSEKSLIASFPP